MPTSLHAELDLAVVAVVVTVGALLRAWISLRKAHLHEKSTTHRFTKALEGSSPPQRPAIIRAMGGAAESQDDDTTPEEPDPDTPADRSFLAWLSRILRWPPSTRG